MPIMTTAQPRRRRITRSRSKTSRDSVTSDRCGSGASKHISRLQARRCRFCSRYGNFASEAPRAGPHSKTGEAPRASLELACLSTKIMAEKKTPVKMMDELTIACGASTASGVDVFAGNNSSQVTVLPASAAHDAHQYRVCDVSGVVEEKTRHYPDDRGGALGQQSGRGHSFGGRAFDRCDDRGRNFDRRTNGAGRSRGRDDRGRGNVSNGLGRGGGGRDCLRYTGNTSQTRSTGSSTATGQIRISSRRRAYRDSHGDGATATYTGTITRPGSPKGVK